MAMGHNHKLILELFVLKIFETQKAGKYTRINKTHEI